jgi:hypothetical protein
MKTESEGMQKGAVGNEVSCRYSNQELVVSTPHQSADLYLGDTRFESWPCTSCLEQVFPSP